MPGFWVHHCGFGLGRKSLGWAQCPPLVSTAVMDSLYGRHRFIVFWENLFFFRDFHLLKSYVCQCGGRFDSEMTLAVHCKLVNHEFREHIPTQKTTSVSIDQRKKMLTSTLPVCRNLYVETRLSNKSVL